MTNFKEERKLLTNQYYDEFLNKFLPVLFKRDLTNKTLEEIKRFKEIANDEDILVRTELSIDSKNIWLAVICKLTHCSFRFGLKYNPVFKDIIEKLTYSNYSGNNEEIKTIIQDLENNYFKYSIHNSKDIKFEGKEYKHLFRILSALQSKIYSTNNSLYNKYRIYSASDWDDFENILLNTSNQVKSEMDENGNLILILENEKFIFSRKEIESKERFFNNG